MRVLYLVNILLVWFIMSRDELGWMEIMHSVRSHNVCCVHHLLRGRQAKDSSGVITKHGVDLLGLAVASGCLNMVKLVLSYHAPQQQMDVPINLLSIASFYGYCDIILYLHEYNTDLINMTAPCSGLTCLMFAVINNHIDAAQLLLSLGADPYARSANNQTILEMTQNKQLKDLLESKTKLKVDAPKMERIRNSPMKLRKPETSSLEKKQKCSLTVAQTPKTLMFLSPKRLKEKTKTLIREKFKKKKHHGKLDSLLKEMGLANYQSLFLAQEIDCKTIFTLTRTDLQKIGITTESEISNILSKIEGYE